MRHILKTLIYLQIMLKTLSKIFPIIDHLYIFQILEYDLWQFIKWFIKYPFKRNLQKKHNLEFTLKIKILLILIIFWILIFNFILGFWLTLLIFIFLSPVFIFLSYITYLPLEIYYKNKLMSQAKQKLASLHSLKIIAITGSYGKTSTKDMLYTLLWKKFRVVKTPKSFNTPMGLSQTILDYLKPNTQIFIAELGAYKIGDIKKLTEFLHPTIGVITAIAPQHLERFGSLENIKKAKFELFKSLPPGGVAIRGLGLEAASKVAKQLGMSPAEIKERIEWLQPTLHRQEIKKQGGMTIIDNTYNTNPESAKTSLKLLHDTPGSQKILITPGLVELGKQHNKYNMEFAEEAAKVVDIIIIVGEFAKKALLSGLKNFPKEKIYTVASLSDAINLLSQIAKPNAVILLENDLPDQYF